MFDEKESMMKRRKDEFQPLYIQRRIFLRQSVPAKFLSPEDGIRVESKVKTLFLLSKGRTVVTVKLPSDSIMGNKDIEMELDMDNSLCNKGLKDIKINLFRSLTVRNKEEKKQEERKLSMSLDLQNRF